MRRSIGLYLFFCIGFTAYQVFATELELNVPADFQVESSFFTFKSNTPSPLPLEQSVGTEQRINSVVRIESRLSKESPTLNSRWGTGVIIGRYTHGSPPFSSIQGLLVLTANHVLLGNSEGADLILTLFTEDRSALSRRRANVFSTDAGRDLALLLVPLEDAESISVDFPKLSLLNPSEFVGHTWVPNYTRINHAMAEQNQISFSYLTPLNRASMVTRDATNSLAPQSDTFWYISGEFVPGMSGGPVFADKVQDSRGQSLDSSNGTLVGLMGYIIDRKSKYGYAYPITSEALKGLLINSFPVTTQNGKGLFSLQEKVSSSSIFELSENISWFAWFGTHKKSSPDGGVADEVSLEFLLSYPKGPVSGEVRPVTIQFRQINDFITLNRDQLLDLLRMKPMSMGRYRSERVEGTPGGGVDGTPGGGVDGTPGGGVDGTPGGGVDGTPGGGVDGTPGGGVRPPAKMSPSPIVMPTFEAEHGIMIKVIYSDRTERLFVLEKTLVGSEVFKPEFLKDLWLKMKVNGPVRLIVRPQGSEFGEIKIRKGKLDLSPLKSQWQPLQPLGKIVWNTEQFKVRYIKGHHGMSLRLKTVFRDTKLGASHRLEVRWGFYTNSKIPGGIKMLHQAYYIDGSQMPAPSEITFKWLNDRLSFYYKNHLVLEVAL